MRPSFDRIRHLLPPRRVKQLRNLLVLLVAFSLYQYVATGAVTWPAAVLDTLTRATGDYANRPQASWKQAKDTLEELGERREGHPIPAFDLTGRVVKVMDGDTLSILDPARKQHTIRLYGIDTPEWDQPHGKEAKRALGRLLADEQVGVVVVDTDRLGRTVGTVYRDDINANLAMVEAGHAWWFSRYAPHNRQLEVAQRQAQDNGRGLWAGRDPTPPWVWRRQRRMD